MMEKVFIGVAWPYANGHLHLGHIAGVYLPADILKRYHKFCGNDVLMVSGSDCHGTPITYKAEEEGVSPLEIAERYHKSFVETWEKLGITFDLFTKTSTENHKEVVSEIFLKLLEKGYIYKGKTESFFCEKCQKFLPDRYVGGTCPHCGDIDARGDQCDSCGKPIATEELKAPKCRFCKNEPYLRESEHFFLKLTALNDELLKWIETKNHWKNNVKNFTFNYLKEGLKDRPITRDIEWGVSVPVEGFDNKRIYVWFEAVIGYLSATKQWANDNNTKERWKDFWQDASTKSYYMIGKDNIPFHSIIWPAILMAYGGLNLPYDVPANEYLNLAGRQFSTSRNWAVWAPDYLEKYDPDPLRYILSTNMPETSDTDFSWPEFIRRNNDELVATYGNLVNRVLTFTYKNFDQMVPEHGEFDALDKEILDRSLLTFDRVGQFISRCQFRNGIWEAMKLAQSANQYLDKKEPWKKIKVNKEECGTSLYVVIQVINTLKTALYPYLPFSSENLNGILGFKEKLIDKTQWKTEEVPSGQLLNQPFPLFKKLEEEPKGDLPTI